MEEAIAGETWTADGVRVPVQWVIERRLVRSFLGLLAVFMGASCVGGGLSLAGMEYWAGPWLGVAFLSSIVGTALLGVIVTLAMSGGSFGTGMVAVGPRGLVVGDRTFSVETIEDVEFSGRSLVLRLHGRSSWSSAPMSVDDPGAAAGLDSGGDPGPRGGGGACTAGACGPVGACGAAAGRTECRCGLKRGARRLRGDVAEAWRPPRPSA